MERGRETGVFALSGAEIFSCAFLERVGRAYASGQVIDWSALYPDGGHCVSLPPYAWQRERLWFDMTTQQDTTSTGTTRTNSDPTNTPSPSGNVQDLRPELLTRLLEAPEEKRKTVLQAYLVEYISRLLEYDSEQLLSPSQSLFDAGMRSVTATRLMNHLQMVLRCVLSPVAVFNYPTIKHLCDYLLTRIEPEHLVHHHETGQKDKKHEASAPLTDINNLSEQEVVSSLLAKLADIERKLE